MRGPLGEITWGVAVQILTNSSLGARLVIVGITFAGAALLTVLSFLGPSVYFGPGNTELMNVSVLAPLAALFVAPILWWRFVLLRSAPATVFRAAVVGIIIVGATHILRAYLDMAWRLIANWDSIVFEPGLALLWPVFEGIASLIYLGPITVPLGALCGFALCKVGLVDRPAPLAK